MNTTWVVVADHTRARLFRAEPPHATLHEFGDMVHPESRMHPRDMAQDEPGTTRDSHGQGVHGMGTHYSPREQEYIRFAHEVVQHLEKAHNTHQFEHLVIAAEPDFLGFLRNAMPHGLRATVIQEIGKELTHIPRAEDIRRHLPERF
jgi:protein required for attachment to host cells